MKFDTKKWEILKIFQILVGLPTPSPQKFSERIIFILIVFLSIFYSANFFSELADTKLSYHEKNFESFKDLIKSKLKVYLDFNFIHRPQNEDLKILFSNSLPIKNCIECAISSVKNRQALIIVPDTYAQYLKKRYSDNSQNPFMKTIKLFFDEQYLAFSYERASPFSEKFDMIFQRIRETNIHRDPRLTEDFEVREIKEDKFRPKEEYIVFLPFLVIPVGCLISILTFASEFILRVLKR